MIRSEPHMPGSEPSMVSMTWPQYIRGECRFNRKVIRLRNSEKRVLAILLMRRGLPTSTHQLIEMIYDPDDEPDHAYTNIGIYIMWLKEKLPGQIESRHGFGYWLIDNPLPPKVKPSYSWTPG